MSNNGSLIPDSWVALPLGEAIEPNRPRASPRDHAGESFVGLEHVEAHTTRLLGTVPAETMKSSAVRFQRNDVLYARMRPYLNKVCADRNGLCSGEFIVFPDTPATCGAFLRYRLNAQDFVSFANRKTTGDRPRVDWGEIKSFPLLLPPRKEQERIADRIDELFTDLDAGVAALERVKRNLKRYRAAVLHAAVTGRLTAAWRKEHGRDDEPADLPGDLPGDELLARILVERRRQWERRTLAGYERKGSAPPKNWKSRYKHPAPPKTDDLPKLPKGWCWARVEQCTQIIQYGTSAKTNDDPNGIPVLRMGNVTTHGTVDYTNLKYLPHDHHEFPELLLAKGDILFSRTNSAELVGKSAVFDRDDGPYSLASYLIRVRTIDGCSPWWLTWCIISPLGRGWLRSVLSHTAGQANVNGTKLADYLIPLPPLAAQAAIVEAVQEKLSQIDGLEAEVEHGLKRAGRLRQAILKAAFAGRLVEQDPRDEPASALLTRLRAEREIAGPKRSEKRRKGATARRKQPNA